LTKTVAVLIRHGKNLLADHVTFRYERAPAEDVEMMNRRTAAGAIEFLVSGSRTFPGSKSLIAG